MERNGHGVQSDDVDTGTWVVALGPEAGKGFLGRVSKLDGKPAYDKPGTSVISSIGEAVPKQKTAVSVEEVLQAEVVTLFPVFDYREVVKEVPVFQNGKMVQDPTVPGIPATMPMRTPLVMPVGFTAEHAPIHLRGKNYDFRFLSQMDTRDAETYRSFARDTIKQMTEMRAAASGLHIATQADVERAARSKA